MLSENLRARLERLNRAALPSDERAVGARSANDAVCGDDDAAKRSARRSIGGGQFKMSSPSAAVIARPLAPTSPLPGEPLRTEVGEHWLIRQPVASFWPAFAQRFEAWQAGRREADASSWPAAAKQRRMSARARRHAAEVDSLARSLPHGTLFLDLETCGLAGSALFLVGLLRHDGNRLVLEQLLARNYAEEQAVLWTLWEAAARAALLVTFNGKSFDWPLVQDRSVYHRFGRSSSAPAMVDLPHVDVLHHARRRWRRRLPDCRLQTLERFLCGRHRSGDIPGREIPEAYRRYVATGRLDEMRSILHHNALDLVTLVELAMLLTRQQSAAHDASAPRAADEAA